MEKKYTYIDWLNGKIVLIYSRQDFNILEIAKPIVVQWENFDLIEKSKIEKKQKSIFNEMLYGLLQKIRSEFLRNFENSQFPKIFIDKEFKSLRALWNDKFICKDEYYNSPIKNDFKKFDKLYYQEMMLYKRDCLVNGVKGKFDAVPSPKSAYHNKNLVLPEVMISAVYEMLKFINNFKKEILKEPTFSNQSDKLNINSTTDEEFEKSVTIEIKNEILETVFSDYDKRFFNGIKSYKFFLVCKAELISRITKPSKNLLDISRPSEIAKYSAIFNFMIQKGLIYRATNHEPFIKYLKEQHNANLPVACVKFPYQISESNRNKLKLIFKDF